MFPMLFALFLTAQAAPQTKDPALAAEDARFAAMVAADTTYLEKALDAGLTYQHSNGTAASSTRHLPSVAARRRRWRYGDPMLTCSPAGSPKRSPIPS